MKTNLRVVPIQATLPFEANVELTGKQAILPNLLCDKNSYISELNAVPVGYPICIDPLSFEVKLEPLTMAEQTAIIQTILFAAGFSVGNLVPVVEGGVGPFDTWSATSLHAETARVRDAVEAFAMYLDVLAQGSTRLLASLSAFLPPTTTASSTSLSSSLENSGRISPKSLDHVVAESKSQSSVAGGSEAPSSGYSPNSAMVASQANPALQMPALSSPQGLHQHSGVAASAMVTLASSTATTSSDIGIYTDVSHLSNSALSVSKISIPPSPTRRPQVMVHRPLACDDSLPWDGVTEYPVFCAPPTIPLPNAVATTAEAKSDVLEGVELKRDEVLDRDARVDFSELLQMVQDDCADDSQSVANMLFNFPECESIIKPATPSEMLDMSAAQSVKCHRVYLQRVFDGRYVSPSHVADLNRGITGTALRRDATKSEFLLTKSSVLS